MDYRREIDGLRAVAVLPVILFHAGFEMFRGGFVGVDVFFVISGYLITTIVLAELDKGIFSIVNFYERRARRILPALFLVMAFCIPMAWFSLLPRDMKDFSQSLIAVSVFASNVLFWRENDYFETTSELKPLLHTWSLAVEEQYYLFFPLFLMLFWKFGRRSIYIALGLVLVASLSVAQWAAYARPVGAFYLLPTRGWELLIGAFVAFYMTEPNRRKFGGVVHEAAGWSGIAMILYAVFFYSNATPFPGLFALVPTLGTALVILFSGQQTVVGRLLSNRVFVGIGLISYSAYLWHQPLFAFARYKSAVEPGHLMFVAMSLLTFSLAYLSWKYVEAPFRAKKRFTRGFVFRFSLIGNLSFLVVGFVGHQTEGFRGRYPEDLLNSAPDMRVFEEQVRECWGQVIQNPTVDNACRLGDKDAPTRFGLLGDSHAGSLLHVLNERAMARRVQGRNYSYRSCPPLSTALPLTSDPGEKACYELRTDFFKQLREDPNSIPEVVVVHARWALLLEQVRYDNGEGGVEPGGPWNWDLPASSGDYSQDMRQEIFSSIKKIIDAGKTVILIYPVPEMGWDVSRVLQRHLVLETDLSGSELSVSYSSFLARNKSAFETLDALGDMERLIRVRPDEIFCNTYVPDRCVAHVDGQALYLDNNHLSNAGADFVLKDIFTLPVFRVGGAQRGIE